MKYYSIHHLFRRVLSCILVLSLLLTAAPLSAHAADCEYFAACSPNQTSLVDGLAEVGCSDTSFAARTKIAELNGIAEADYAGTAEQNQELLGLLKAGRLIKSKNNAATVTAPTTNVVYYAACNPNQTSLVDGLAEVGCSDTSFSTRAKIAALNGIPEADYAGTADQNMTLLSLLKNGLLIKGKGTSMNTGTSEPAQTMGSTQSYEIMETAERAYLRTAPSKGATAVTVLPANTLVYVLGKEVNSAGNLWYRIQYFDQTLYCFAKRLAPHEHDYVIAPAQGGDARICECGQVRASTPQQTFALTASAISMLYVGIAVLTTVVCAKHHDAIYDAADALIYGAEEVADAVGSYGLRVINNGLIVAIKLNRAGVVTSVSVDEFTRYMQENTNDPGEKKYFPATVIKDANGSDSVMVVNPLGTAMTKNEACDYIDATLAVDGAFSGKFWNFQNAIPYCNIYTFLKDDAIDLCNQVVDCKKNVIELYGLSTIKKDASGLLKPEHNTKECNIIGTYEHFHLHKLTDSYEAVKSCPHVFFDNMYVGPDTKAA